MKTDKSFSICKGNNSIRLQNQRFAHHSAALVVNKQTRKVWKYSENRDSTTKKKRLVSYEGLLETHPINERVFTKLVRNII